MGRDTADTLHPEDGPAVAFSRLAREVMLLRCAIEGLAAARDGEVPDYAPTLLRTEQLLAALADEIRAVVHSPALSMTPDMLAAKIVNAAHSARLDDQRLVNEARVALDQAAQGLAGCVASARGRTSQDRWLYGGGAGALVVGALFWAGIAGPMTRSMPRSWHWPERMAARAVDEPMWVAGQDLMMSANPAAWHAIVCDEAIARSNHAAAGGLRTAGVQATCTTRGITERTGP